MLSVTEHLGLLWIMKSDGEISCGIADATLSKSKRAIAIVGRSFFATPALSLTLHASSGVVV